MKNRGTKSAKLLFHVVVKAFSCCLVAGCASIPCVVGRFLSPEHEYAQNRPNDLRLIAVRSDGKMIKHFGWEKASGIEDMWSFKGWWPLAIFPILDLPLAVVTDTICFPYDAYKVSTHKDNVIIGFQTAQAYAAHRESGSYPHI
jgi:uncharacterized protein YceK